MHMTSAFQLRETALGAAEQLLCIPKLTWCGYIRSFRQRAPRIKLAKPYYLFQVSAHTPRAYREAAAHVHA
jgi:hypothetical protein